MAFSIRSPVFLSLSFVETKLTCNIVLVSGAHLKTLLIGVGGVGERYQLPVIKYINHGEVMYSMGLLRWR